MHMDTVLASFVVYDYVLFWVILVSHDMSDFIPGNCGRHLRSQFRCEVLSHEVLYWFFGFWEWMEHSYLYDLDYPESKRKPIFTLDGFYSSNVARFINHRSAFLVKFSFFMRVLSCTTNCLFAWCLWCAICLHRAWAMMLVCFVVLLETSNH
jgi:hypothetical protein